ncbi:MAG: FAD-dependent oxidoreductase [Syntrophomonadaceae bacterium]
MREFSHLFSPTYVGNLLVKNRVVMAPMLVGYSNLSGEVTESMVDYYEARARGGVGIIIVEAACVDSPTGKQSCRQLNIDHPRYISGLERLSQTIKIYGARAFIQLFHAGRQTSQAKTGVQPVAPSAIPCPIIKEVPRELTIEEIQGIINKFILAASYANAAGFEGVEIHAAHGYLINQFLSAYSNQRTDQYGGDLPNRMRILLDIVKGIKLKTPELAVSVRLNIDDFVQNGLDINQSKEICRQLKGAGVDLINCSCGVYESGLKSIEPSEYEDGWRVYLAAEIKRSIDIPVIAGGIIRTPELGEQVIKEGKADFIFVGRSILADSQWCNKAQDGRVEDIRPCITCNHCIDSTLKGLEVRCTVNPWTGRERQFNYFLSPVRAVSSALVVGSGPAGMQAALSLKRQGLDVSLYERDNKPGGLLNVAANPPYKHRIRSLRDFLVRQLNKNGIHIALNRNFELKDLQNGHPDYLIIATGCKPITPKIPGYDPRFCLDLLPVLEGIIDIRGKEVIIIGGGDNGCEVADYLLTKNNRVTIVESNLTLAPSMEKKNRRALLNRLKNKGAILRVGCTVTRIGANEVEIIANKNDFQKLTADCIVQAIGFQPNNELYFELKEHHPHVTLIGDAFGTKGIASALLQGEVVGYMISEMEKLKG